VLRHRRRMRIWRVGNGPGCFRRFRAAVPRIRGMVASQATRTYCNRTKFGYAQHSVYDSHARLGRPAESRNAHRLPRPTLCAAECAAMPRYIRSWRRLDEALADGMKAGLTESDAKQDICDAIADRVIDFRAMVELEVEDDDGGLPGYRNDKSQSRIEGCWLASRQVKIPARLKPPDFNWEHSSPKDEWYSTFNSSIDDPHPRIGAEPEYRKIREIQLQASDISKLFSEPPKQAEHVAQTQLAPQAHADQPVTVGKSDLDDSYQLPPHPPRPTQRTPYRRLQRTPRTISRWPRSPTVHTKTRRHC
jgi:hypothetical protein